MVNIVCLLRNGGKVGYDSQWVSKLKNSLERNVSLPYKFYCLSDSKVDCETIPLDNDDHGFWSKMQLFKPGLFDKKTLYIDLDTVICKNIDEIIQKCENEKFVMWYEKDKNISSSAMMYWDGDYSYLWEIYKSKPLEYWEALYAKPPLYGDQAIISENVKHNTFLDLCPNDWFHIASKHDNFLDLSNIKILMFRKVSQKPSTMLEHPLVKNHWS